MSAHRKTVSTASTFADQIRLAGLTFNGIIDANTVGYRTAAATNMIAVIRLGSDEEAAAADAVMQSAAGREYIAEDGTQAKGVIPGPQYKDWQKVRTARFVDPIERADKTLRAPASDFPSEDDRKKCAAGAGFALLGIAEGDDQQKKDRAMATLEALASERKLPKFIFEKYETLKAGGADEVERAIRTFNDDTATDSQRLAAGFALFNASNGKDEGKKAVAAQVLRQLADEQRLPGAVYWKYKPDYLADKANDNVAWAESVLRKEVQSTPQQFDAASFVLVDLIVANTANNEQIELIFGLADEKLLMAPAFGKIRGLYNLFKDEEAKQILGGGVSSLTCSFKARTAAAFRLIEIAEKATDEKLVYSTVEILRKALEAKLWNHPEAYARFTELLETSPLHTKKREQAKAKAARTEANRKERAEAQQAKRPGGGGGSEKTRLPTNPKSIKAREKAHARAAAKSGKGKPKS